jgi:hypothetical protein
MRTIKEIALELLDKYAIAQESVIWEHSGNIEEDVENLRKEVANYKDEIRRSK